MRYFLFTLLSILGFTIYGQTYKIPQTDYPYYDIIEWKGFGSLLMSKDPSGNSKHVKLTLVGHQETTIWDETFAQRNDEFYYLASDNTTYAYFIHNLELEAGKVFLSQLNGGGNIKSTSVSFTSQIKQLGFDVLEIELREIVVTDKALVYIFRHYDKKEKSFTEIAGFVTHHNLLTYAAIIGTGSEELIRDGKNSHWQYAGFDGDKIFFSVHETINKRIGSTVKSFTSKGKEIESVFINDPKDELIDFSSAPFGTVGAQYLNLKSKDSQASKVYFQNGHYYLLAASNNNGKVELNMYQLENAEWKKIKSQSLSSDLIKKGFSLGVFPTLEGFSCHVEGAGSNLIYGLSLTPKGETSTLQYTEKSIFNPSRVFVTDQIELFAVILPEGVLFFNLNQLNSKSEVEFEFVEK